MGANKGDGSEGAGSACMDFVLRRGGKSGMTSGELLRFHAHQLSTPNPFEKYR